MKKLHPKACFSISNTEREVTYLTFLLSFEPSDWEFLALSLLNPSLDKCLRLDYSGIVQYLYHAFYRHFSNMIAVI